METSILIIIPVILLVWVGISIFIIKKKINAPWFTSERARRISRRIINWGEIKG